MSDLDELVAGARSAVSDAKWPDATQVRARGDQRSTRLRVVAGTAGAVAVILAAALAVLPATHRPQPPTNRVTPGPTASELPPAPKPAAPKVLRQGSITRAGEPLAMASAHGSVWLAFTPPPLAVGQQIRGPGELLRVDPQTLKVTAHWPIAGSPEAMVVTDKYVWVAGDVGDLKPIAQDANEVRQYDLAGKLLHSYPVDTPAAIAAQGDSLWVEYGLNEPGYLGHLHDGIADPPQQLSGETGTAGYSDHALAVCPDGIYATSDNGAAQTRSVDRVVPGTPMTTVTLPGLGDAWLACRPGRGVLAVLFDTAASTVRQLFVDGTDDRVLASLPGLSIALDGSETQLWIGRTDAADVRLFNWSSLKLGDPLTNPGIGTDGVADSGALWTVAGEPLHDGTWLITAIGPG